MSTLIQWQKQDNVLLLSGALDRLTLNTLWRDNSHIIADVRTIDVSALTRVDSAGLALLVYYCSQFDIILTGISTQLSTLIELYNLQLVINKHDNQ